MKHRQSSTMAFMPIETHHSTSMMDCTAIIQQPSCPTTLLPNDPLAIIQQPSCPTTLLLIASPHTEVTPTPATKRCGAPAAPGGPPLCESTQSWTGHTQTCGPSSEGRVYPTAGCMMRDTRRWGGRATHNATGVPVVLCRYIYIYMPMYVCFVVGVGDFVVILAPICLASCLKFVNFQTRCRGHTQMHMLCGNKIAHTTSMET